MDPPSIIIQNEGYRGDINERRLSVVSFREIVKLSLLTNKRTIKGKKFTKEWIT